MFRCPPGEGARSEHQTTQAGAIGVDRGGFTAKHLFAEYAAHFGVLGSKDINKRKEVMTDKKQKTKEQGRNIDVREPQATVTMLDYEGSPVVTYSIIDKHANPKAPAQRGSS